MWLGWMDKAMQCIYCECFFSPILCYGAALVSRRPLHALPISSFLPPVRLGYRCSILGAAAAAVRPARRSPFFLLFLCPSLRPRPRPLRVSTRARAKVVRPTRRSVCVCARVKRRCWQCWLWRCQVSYNCICAVALRETGYS